MNIIYIHGAGASPLSFRWMQQQFENHNIINIHYSVNHSLFQVCQMVSDEIVKVEGEVVIIGHSFGGVVAARMIDDHRVSKIITLSAPFGGVALASLISLMSGNAMFRDLCPYGSVIRSLRKISRGVSYAGRHLAFVTTSGLPLMHEPNDGVVTVASQTSITGPNYVYFDLNHFEILLSDGPINHIKEFLWKDNLASIA